MASPEFVANILLFVPLGLLLRLAAPRVGWVGATAIGAVVSVAIEVMQVWTPRVSDPRDIVANALGALAGALLGAVFSHLASPRVHDRSPAANSPAGTSTAVSTPAVSATSVSRPGGRPGAG